MRSALFLLLAAVAVNGQNFPEAEISNGVIRAKLYLPDSERGYYRGSRFDWAGVIASLEYQGHSYFGVWFDHYNPRLHDAITGPVEEFQSKDGGIGYEAAAAHGVFLKIGVGVLRKNDEQPYRFVTPYDIVNGGQWVVRPEHDRVEFVQTLHDEIGYRYEYRKTVRLVREKPRLVLEHSLKNLSKTPLETNVYDHDFFMLDGKPTGPGVTIRFPFAVRAQQSMRGLAEAEGKEVIYRQELQKGETATSYLEGFGDTPSDYDIRVENANTGAGVRQTSDHSMVKLNLWSIRSTVCPEAFIRLDVPPGKTEKWKIFYDFYTVPAGSAAKRQE